MKTSRAGSYRILITFAYTTLLLLESADLSAATVLRASATRGTAMVSVANSGPSAGAVSDNTSIGSGLDRASVAVKAGFGSLSADARTIGRPEGLSSVEGRVSFSTDDVSLSIIDVGSCEPICVGFYPVTLTARVDGRFAQFTGADVPGRGRAEARLSASGNIFSGAFGQRFASNTVGDSQFFDSHADGDGLGSAAKSLTISFYARPGDAYSISGSLEVVAGSGYGFFGERSGIVSDFSSTWSFNPNEVFSLPSNVSAQAPSLGLLDNQLPHLVTLVPLPLSAALMGPVLLFLAQRKLRPGQTVR